MIDGHTHEIASGPALRDEFPLPAGGSGSAQRQGEGDGGWQLSGTWRFAWDGVLFSFAQSGRLHRQFAGALVCGAFLPPHPGPLPEARENRTLRFRQSGARRLVAARDAVFPLPAGEGQGEGERDAANQHGRTNFASSTRPAPRLRVGNHVERKGCRWSKGARSQARWCFERCFPLTPPSPLGRGRIARRYVANRTRWVVRMSRRLIAERTVPVGATPDLTNSEDASSLPQEREANRPAATALAPIPESTLARRAPDRPLR